MAHKRKQYGVRPTAAISAKLEEVTVNGHKISYSQYVTNVLAEHFGLPNWEVAIAPECDNQQELPMTA